MDDLWNATVLMLEAVLLDGVECDFELAVELLAELIELDAAEVEAEDHREWVRFDPTDKQWTASKWKETFRFQKKDMDRLFNALQLPETMSTAGGKKTWSGFEGLCIVLRRLSYPCRLKDLEDTFGRGKADISEIFNATLLFMQHTWHDLLITLTHPWLTVERLHNYARAVESQDSPLDNVWGFIDGTVRPICRPTVGQRLMYNGHKRVHSMKFQSVVTPDGMIVNLHGPVEGRRHDAFMLADSGLLRQLEERMNIPDAEPGASPVFSLYGHPAYPVSAYLLCPYRGG